MGRELVVIGKPPYYEIFSFWTHELLLMDDGSVRAAKKCNESLPILMLGQDTIIHYSMKTETEYGKRISSYWETSIILWNILILGS
jgi:hypothetical protein